MYFIVIFRTKMCVYTVNKFSCEPCPEPLNSKLETRNLQATGN
jgi:hypothetical protein